MRRSRRLATRGVPRERCAISSAALGVDRDLQHVGGAPDDEVEVLGRVVVEPLHDAEPRAHRRRQHAEARRRADQRELLDRHRDRLRLGPFGQPDVDPVVLHRRVEELLDDRAQPMDLVDEEDVARAQVGERADEIRRLLERGARRRPDVDAQLARDQLGERRLAESRWPEEERVVERLAPRERGVDRRSGGCP